MDKEYDKLNQYSSPRWSKDLTSDANLSLEILRGDVRKLYYLMLLTGTQPAYAVRFLYNLQHSDQRAGMVQIRNILIRSLKQVFMKILHDPILFQRARVLAVKKDFNVFEAIQNELKKTLDESAIDDIMKKLTSLHKNEDYRKKLANHIINFTEELQGTGGTQIGTPQGTGTSDGIDSHDQPFGVIARRRTIAKRKKGNQMEQTTIQRTGTMVGNPHFILNAEGFAISVNGSLPTEINEALNETGIVVLENSETEQMMFLIKEDTKEAN